MVSVRGAWIAAALLSVVGCRRPVETAPSVVAPVELSAVEPAPEQLSAPTLSVTIRPGGDLEGEPAELRVGVVIELLGPPEPDIDLREWSLAGPLAGPFTAAISDAAGPVEHRIEASGLGVRVVLERPPSLPLRLEYSVAPVAAEIGSVARVELDDAHMFATGEALLLLPEGLLDQRRALAIDIDPAAFADEDPDASIGLPPLRAASSFAAEPAASVEGWPFELRRAAFMIGRVEWAEFDSMGGDDRWLGVGNSRFDQRWSAAEIAGVRSAIDGKIGMPTLEPLVTMLVAGSRAAAEPAFQAELRGRGLVILADQNAFWDAGARMSTTQALLARWLGGRIRVLTEPEAAHPQHTELWFTAGVTRFIARELLYGLGLLDDAEYIVELDQIELELASSPLRQKTLAELAAIADADLEKDPSAALAAGDAQALLIARGATYAAFLDAELRRSQGPYSNGLAEVLRMLVAAAVAENRREYPVGKLIGRAAFQVSYKSPPEAEFAAIFERTVIAGQRPELRADTYGPCFRPRKTKLRRFDLGLIDTTRLSDRNPSFTALDPDGPAAKAGLEPDDRLLALDYVPGDASAWVELSVMRNDQAIEIGYQPAGPKLQVVQWHRVAGVPAEQCVRP